MKEFRVFGPPGTGKTTWLTREISKAADLYGAQNILCSSFTRTAATELTSRLEMGDSQVSSASVGTVHALCYRALGCPTIAETKIADWNAAHPTFSLKKTNASVAMDEGALTPDDATTLSDGEKIFQRYNRLRNRNVVLPADVRRFADAWEDWKQQNGYMDFTDLLIHGRDDLIYPPNNASVMFVDEAQDLTPLQLSVVRGWARNMDYFVLVGDEDQTLYSFTGADPGSLIDPDFPADRKLVLSQSWRIPASVHRLATKWIRKVSRRETKEYRPQDREGRVVRCPATFKDAREAVWQAKKAMEQGKSVMFLTSCGYMLRGELGVLNLLKQNGIAFCNPYRLTQGEWNPQSPAKTRAFASFCFPSGPTLGTAKLWNREQMADWIGCIPQGSFLQRGAKEALKKIRDTDEDGLLGWYAKYFLPEGFNAALEASARQDVRWLLRTMSADKRKAWEFPAVLWQKRNDNQPRCVVGTIHSVKGGEADVVFLFPDISPTTSRAIQLGDMEARDATIRQFYVGQTRARDELVVCSCATPHHTGIIR